MTSHDAHVHEVQRKTWGEMAHYDANGIAYVGVGYELEVVLANSRRTEADELVADLRETLLSLPRSDALTVLRQVMQMQRMIAPERPEVAAQSGEWTHDGATGGPVKDDEKPAAEVAAEAVALTEALEKQAEQGLPAKPDAVEKAVSGNRRQAKQANK